MSKDIDSMTDLEIEGYVRNRKLDEWSKKQELERQAEKVFKETTNVHIYESSDYCGMENGEVSFYYGYEVTQCPKHKTERQCEAFDCELREWCFTAQENGIEVLRLPTSKLWFIGDAHVMWYLLSGIGQYLRIREQS